MKGILPFVVLGAVVTVALVAVFALPEDDGDGGVYRPDDGGTVDTGPDDPGSNPTVDPDTSPDVPGKDTSIDEPQPSSGEITWSYDYESATASARSSGKPVMIDFYTDWCGYCVKLDEETYSDPAVIAESQRFVNLKVDGDARQDLVQQYAVSGYPTIIFLDGSGNEVSRVPGFVDANSLLSEMQKV